VSSSKIASGKLPTVTEATSFIEDIAEFTLEKDGEQDGIAVPNRNSNN
jgi:hypothetical protein